MLQTAVNRTSKLLPRQNDLVQGREKFIRDSLIIQQSMSSVFGRARCLVATWSCTRSAGGFVRCDLLGNFRGYFASAAIIQESCARPNCLNVVVLGPVRLSVYGKWFCTIAAHVDRF